jgi:hypothetical protein
MSSKTSPSVVGHLTRVASSFRRRWIAAGAFAGLLVAIAIWSNWAVQSSLASSLESQLQTILDADVAALEGWLDSLEKRLRIRSTEPRTVRLVQQLLTAAEQAGDDIDALRASTALEEIREYLDPIAAGAGYAGFGVVDQGGRIIAVRGDQYLGQRVPTRLAAFVSEVLSGRIAISHPFRSDEIAPGGETARITPSGTMLYAAAPVRNAEGRVIAFIAFTLDPEADFSRLLQVARIGESGEAYAFDRNGLMLSDSRFEDELKSIGLIPDEAGATSVLTVRLRDPGGNLMASHQPSGPPEGWPLTEMAAQAVSGKSGVNVSGYRDYRGVEVVGAWTWLEEYDFGVCVEVDAEEAFRPVTLLKWAHRLILAALGLGVLGLLVGTRMLQKMNRQVVRAQNLGQYTLLDKIGEGGMGKVYKASHAMLQRPTAVKLIGDAATGPETLARFEREVQLTSTLTHPNTIIIYDYGRTPEGIFYYAMEFLEGADLEEIVRQTGPMPEGRVIHLLEQACGSLAEAHDVGFIHRDIKPANIYACRRGGQWDRVKVLDFGLVKDIQSSGQPLVTATDVIAGTPQYLSPEAIRNPGDIDARTDIYSMGCVAYYLLTGRLVFEADTAVQVISHHLETEPHPPSELVGREIEEGLQALVLRCLAKRPDERPQSAQELRHALLACRAAGSWTDAEADAWWAAHPALVSRWDSSGKASP